MRPYLCLFLLFFVFTAVSAQNLDVQHDGDKLYLTHKVIAKENWYSIGRMYNASPKELAPFNNTTLEKGLAIGQILKIPLTPTNFLQSGQPAVDEVLVPLYHKVKEKEGLYRISQTYHKVPTEQVKTWNKLKSDELSVGAELIIGYLAVKQEISSLAKNGQRQMTSAAVAKTTAPPVTTPVVKETTVPIKETPVPVPPKDTNTKPAAVNNNPSVTTVNKPVAESPGSEGAFAVLFADQTKNNPPKTISGQAATFKSTSGWKDGKYYVLMNKVTPGTIVRVHSNSTNKTVYAKVLGEIPPGAENEGLLIRLSNAASAQLMTPEGKFEVQLQY